MNLNPEISTAMEYHNLVCHYEEFEFVIREIVPSEYSIIALFVDIWSVGAKHIMPEPLHIKVTCGIPGSSILLSLDTDEDIMVMFGLYEHAKVIHLSIEKLESPTPLLKSAMELYKLSKDAQMIRHGHVVDVPNLDTMEGYASVSTDDDWDPECVGDIESCSSEGQWHASDEFSMGESDDHSVSDGDIREDDDNDIPKYIQNGKWYADQINGKIKFEVGHLFENKKKFLNVLQSYAIQEGFALDKKRNLKKKFWATCKDSNPNSSTVDDNLKMVTYEPCPWRIYASLLPDDITYQIKTLTDKHTCIRLDKNPSVKASWVADMLAIDFRAAPSMDIKTMKDLMNFRFGVRIGKSMLYRARGILKESMEGSHKDSYARLPTYIKLIMERNPGSITGITWTRPENPQVNPLFKKIFISFEAMKEGFINGCRPFIGVDGTHLKGKFGGTLLVACALDGDGGIFPIAYGVVDKETTETWEFFFYHLKRMAPQEERKKWVICSDRQKGVECALSSILPEVSRRICARHLYANFKQQWPGELLKSYFWTAAKAHNEFVFFKAMDQIKKNGMEAYNYLMAVPLELWARHKFDKSLKVGDVTNNFVESFNGKIRELRGLPILSMLEGLRRRCMKKMYKKKKSIAKWDSSICPKVKKMCDWAWKDGYYCIPRAAGEGLYEVKDGTHFYNVNLREQTCDCQSWQNLGIPCKHAASGVRHMREKLEQYVHPFYSSQKYAQVYRGIICPIPDHTKWLEDQEPRLNPPLVTRRSGRPRVQRHREKGEPVRVKRCSVVKCSTCGILGHNKRGCQGGETRKSKKLAGTRRQNES
ncbi:uncharacterized protein LOC141592455 [Silene latifolia]|uniref:uncharacterized protein LOC141592455 n=1 Tax=Silene latifolia TaxID=37657 RepID=UPI003D776A9E